MRSYIDTVGSSADEGIDVRRLVGLAMTAGIVLAGLVGTPAAAAEAAPTLTIAVNSFDRDLRTGQVAIDMSIVGTKIFSGSGYICRGSYCELEVESSGSQIHSIYIQDHPRDAAGGLNMNLSFETTSIVSEVRSLRVYIRNGLYTSPMGIVSNDVFIDDTSYPAGPYLSAAVDTFLRSQDGSRITFDLTILARYHQWPGAQCSGNCTVRVEARTKGTNAVTSLPSSSVNANTGALPLTARVSGELQLQATGPGVDALRVVADPYSVFGSNTYGAWIPVSMDISGGYSIDESVTALVLALASSPAPCIELFPVGTHTNPSSLNDQQLECTAAMQNGKSLGAFVRAFIEVNGASQLATMFVGAGLAQDKTTLQRYPWSSSEAEINEIIQNPPNGLVCKHVPVLSFSCVREAEEPDVFRLPSAPPPSNPTWERNQIEKIRQADPKPKLPPIPAPVAEPGPWTGASEDDYIRTILRQCQKQIVLAPEAGLPKDACSTMPIFATGSDVKQATDHDMAALKSHPTWLVLTYASNAEKLADGFTRSWWSSTHPCATGPVGNSCDEFPYFATDQGGANGQSAMQPSLRSISSAHNSLQGTHYGNFATKKCKLGSDPRGAPERDFLVVPVPYMTTSYWCGD
ncbi:hypothetical protein ELQ92_06795 [Labedella populi]|uniref:Deoxyribonuclease NucA/NucB domain-containing protein n=1 Tax=Labedella populi TaxID=2498850 RepID=A0A3S4AB34_9MICO|nr:hypothetical protein [Labedella populi]RWZ64466.1 hypothetical protein ELQ92_06795 [Labedella populi]